MSQAVLAEMAGVHVNTIHRIECGEIMPSMTTLEGLSKALKVKMADLLPGGGR